MKRILLIGVTLIILLVLAGAGALYWFLSGDGIRRTLERQASARLGQPVHIGTARAQLLPRIGIQLTDVRVGEPARITLQRVGISTGLRPLLSRRIEDADILLADSRIELPLPIGLPPADEGAAPSDDAASDGGVELVSVRAITLRNITLASRGREVTVSADSSLAGDTLELERFTATSGRTALEASGRVELAPAIDATLTLEANQLDVDELLTLASAFSAPGGGAAATQKPVNTPQRSAGGSRAAPAAGKPAHIAATITADVARTGTLEVRNLSATVDIRGDRVTLSPLTFQLFGGAYAGSITATLGAAMAATIRSQLKDLDVAQLAAYGGAAGTATGRLSADGTFTGSGADIESALASARGSGTARMVNGEITRLGLVRTVVLFFGRPAADAPGSSDGYEQIDLAFSLANQVVRADSFALRSRDFDLTGSGTLSLRNQALDGAFNLLLSAALSKQAGTDLARYTREGDRVVLPTRLGGTLESPRVTIDAKAALQRGLRNEAERRLKGLLDGLVK